MERSQLMKGAIGSVLIGAGIAFMVSAASGCAEDQGEGILEEVAAASADLDDGEEVDNESENETAPAGSDTAD